MHHSSQHSIQSEIKRRVASEVARLEMQYFPPDFGSMSFVTLAVHFNSSHRNSRKLKKTIFRTHLPVWLAYENLNY